MTSPNFSVTPSDEVKSEELMAGLLGVDWSAIFGARLADLRDIGARLAEEQDPNGLITLTLAEGNARTLALGSGAISSFQRVELADRAAFEAQFGEL